MAGLGFGLGGTRSTVGMDGVREPAASGRRRVGSPPSTPIEWVSGRNGALLGFNAAGEVVYKFPVHTAPVNMATPWLRFLASVLGRRR